MGSLQDELTKHLPLPEIDDDGHEAVTWAGKIRDYLEKREKGLLFTTAALCAALNVPLEDHRARKTISHALTKAAKRRYIEEKSRISGEITYLLTKEGEWKARSAHEAAKASVTDEEPVLRNQAHRQIPQNIPITHQVKLLLSEWPVRSQFSYQEVARMCGHEPKSTKGNAVRTALSMMVHRDYTLAQRFANRFEIVAPVVAPALPEPTEAEISAMPDNLPDEEFDKQSVELEAFGKAMEAPPAPRVTEGPPYFEGRVVASDVTMIAKDPDLQVVLDALLILARQVCDMEPPEPMKGLDDYTMDELLDAIALKRMK